MAKVHMIEAADDAAIADWLEQRLAEALAKGPAAICLPGGSTPFPILTALAQRQLNWQQVSVWPGDDRAVPSDHPASNLGRIAAILGPVGAKCVALAQDARPPRFALTWLGMGADGHIASLFPNTDPDPHDKSAVLRLTPDPLPPEAPYDRLSLTIPALLNCDTVLFVIRGAEKRALFEAAARGENDLPVARLLAATTQPVTCFA
jgi:6-phosphogluconolactonase